MMFFDLTFDIVSRDGLCKNMEKLITLVCQFHDGMMVKVFDDGNESEAFPVTTGVKQRGCCVD